MEPRLLFALAAFGLMVTFLVFSRSEHHEFKSRTWMLLRALFPSWRFFEDLVWVPKLSMRIGEEGPWVLCLPEEKRGFHSLFLNGRGNMRMAARSLVEQFVSDLEGLSDASKVERSVSYQLLVKLARFRIHETVLARAGEKFQFKIESVTPGLHEREDGDTLIISAVHEV